MERASLPRTTLVYLYVAGVVVVLLFLLRGLLSAGADFTTRLATSFLEFSIPGVVSVVRIMAGDASLDSISLSFLLVLRRPGDGVAVLFILFLNFFLGGVTVTTSEYTLFLLLLLDDVDVDVENVTFDSD